MAPHEPRLWTDRSWLRDIQDRTEANLAARQSIYAYQHPRLNLPAWTLGLAGLTGTDGTIRVRAHTGCLVAR